VYSKIVNSRKLAHALVVRWGFSGNLGFAPRLLARDPDRRLVFGKVGDIDCFDGWIVGKW